MGCSGSGGECLYVLYALGFGNLCAFGVSRWRAETQRHTHQAGPHENNLIRNLNKWQCPIHCVVRERKRKSVF